MTTDNNTNRSHNQNAEKPEKEPIKYKKQQNSHCSLGEGCPWKGNDGALGEWGVLGCLNIPFLDHGRVNEGVFIWENS